MAICFFSSDLHGRPSRFEALLRRIDAERPAAVLLGGDLLPSAMFAFTSSGSGYEDFLDACLLSPLARLRSTMASDYPRVFVILGNDDGLFEQGRLREAEREGLIDYISCRKAMFGETPIYGYPYVPPTPFRLKDLERYDVSRFVDPGCVAPEDGLRSAPEETGPAPTIQQDLADLFGADELSRAIVLFHAPPYGTALDRAALDGKMVDWCPLNVQVGSIAIRRFIEARQPMLTLHGHVHEAARLTGKWREQIGRTLLFGGAHDGPELALVRFDSDDPSGATRELV